MAAFDVSRAIRGDLARRIREGCWAGMSFSVPDDIVVHLDDTDSARRVLSRVLGSLLDGTESGLLSASQPDATTVVLTVR